MESLIMFVGNIIITLHEATGFSERTCSSMVFVAIFLPYAFIGGFVLASFETLVELTLPRSFVVIVEALGMVAFVISSIILLYFLQASVHIARSV